MAPVKKLSLIQDNGQKNKTVINFQSAAKAANISVISAVSKKTLP